MNIAGGTQNRVPLAERGTESAAMPESAIVIPTASCKAISSVKVLP
jgi:hypothetical protein